jgi:hypothetical protein
MLMLVGNDLMIEGDNLLSARYNKDRGISTLILSNGDGGQITHHVKDPEKEYFEYLQRYARP